MFQAQKDYLKAISKQDKHVLLYFPRQIGKTYVRNYIKRVGETAVVPHHKSREAK